MKLMDQKTEAGLHEALRDMIAAVNHGEQPTQALVKVASARGLNNDMVRVLGQSYNASRSIAHHQAFNGQDRCRPFSLASPDEAIDIVANNTKTAAERFTAAQLRRTQHLTEPGARVNFFDRALKLATTHEPEVTTEKTAAATPATEPTPAERYTKQQEKLAAVRRARVEADSHEMAVYTTLNEAVHDVRMNLRTVPFDTLEQGLAARYGVDQGVKLANVLFEALNGKGLRQKRATSFDRCVFDYNLSPFSTIDRFVLSAVAAAESASKLAAAREDAAPVPFAQAPSNDPTGLLPWDRAKVAAWLPATQSILSDIVPSGDAGKPNPDRAFEEALDSMSGSSQNTQTRNIRVQAMLKELMSEDPVIGTYDPDEVIDRYNEVVNVAPHLSDKKLAIRGILRRSLQQGNVDPFEVGQYLSMNKAQQEQNHADNSILESAASTAGVLRKGDMSYQRSKDNQDDAYRQKMLGTQQAQHAVDQKYRTDRDAVAQKQDAERQAQAAKAAEAEAAARKEQQDYQRGMDEAKIKYQLYKDQRDWNYRTGNSGQSKDPLVTPPPADRTGNPLLGLPDPSPVINVPQDRSASPVEAGQGLPWIPDPTVTAAPEEVQGEVIPETRGPATPVTVTRVPLPPGIRRVGNQ